MNKFFICFVVLFFFSCSNSEEKFILPTPDNEAPEWAAEVVWYQIFVERFRNGNKSNDPTLETVHNSLMDDYPSSWNVTPWEHDWYQQEDWAKETGLDFYRTAQMRRYGGDLEGVIEKLPYLKELGVTGIYFNPLNDAPTLHKYDARSYHHIDVTFGGSIQNNLDTMAIEDPSRPETWTWTEADSTFLRLIKLCHESDIKVILDYSFNHTGREFWAFKDIVQNQESSRFKDWYEINSFANEEKGTEFDYEGWIGIKELPELKKIQDTPKTPGRHYEGNLPKEIKEHIFAVCRRWIDPNNDGDFSDGVDGFRLDVAEHVPMGFWRDFRTQLRSINSELLLVGENWWTNWPDTLMDPEPWVKGDVFDAVMHYQWYKPARRLFGNNTDSISTLLFYSKMDSIWSKYRWKNSLAMMNLTASHDSPRFWTSINNSTKYKVDANPRSNPDYDLTRPDLDNLRRGKALLLHQFTMIGAPHIWNGDEKGMVGGDDPDCRKPILWEDIKMADESSSEFSNYDIKEANTIDTSLVSFYKGLIKMRNDNATLQKGDIIWNRDYLDKGLLAYTRILESDTLDVFINTSNNAVDIFNQYGNSVFENNVDRYNDQIIFKSYGGVVVHRKSSK